MRKVKNYAMMIQENPPSDNESDWFQELEFICISIIDLLTILRIEIGLALNLVPSLYLTFVLKAYNLNNKCRTV